MPSSTCAMSAHPRTACAQGERREALHTVLTQQDEAENTTCPEKMDSSGYTEKFCKSCWVKASHPSKTGRPRAQWRSILSLLHGCQGTLLVSSCMCSAPDALLCPQTSTVAVGLRQGGKGRMQHGIIHDRPWISKVTSQQHRRKFLSSFRSSSLCC